MTSLCPHQQDTTLANIKWTGNLATLTWLPSDFLDHPRNKWEVTKRLGQEKDVDLNPGNYIGIVLDKGLLV